MFILMYQELSPGVSYCYWHGGWTFPHLTLTHCTLLLKSESNHYVAVEDQNLENFDIITLWLTVSNFFKCYKNELYQEAFFF